MLPNDSHVAGAASTFATHTISGKEYPVGLQADSAGHILGSLPAYGFVIPPSAVAANKVWFDLHNAQAGSIVRLRKLFAVPQIDTAITGALGVRIDAFRTNSIGTGGTALTKTAGNASAAAASFYSYDPAQALLPAGITGRNAPTGGAAAEAWLWPGYFFTEETNAGSHLPQFYDLIPHLPMEQPLEFPNGYGFKLQQGTVAGVGSIGFFGAFTVE